MAQFFSPHFFSPRVHLLFIPLFSPPQASSLHSLLTSVQTPSLIILLGSFSLSLTLDVVALCKPTPFIRLSLGTCLVHHSAIYLSILFFCFPIITPVQTVYCPCPSLCDHCFHPPLFSLLRLLLPSRLSALSCGEFLILEQSCSCYKKAEPQVEANPLSDIKVWRHWTDSPVF